MTHSNHDQPRPLHLVQVTLRGRRVGSDEMISITSVSRLASGRYDAARYITRAIALARLRGMDPTALADIRALTSNGSVILPHHGGDLSALTGPAANELGALSKGAPSSSRVP